MKDEVYSLGLDEVSNREVVRRRNVAVFQELQQDGTIDVFNLLRQYITHEDGLVNQRSGWFLTLNSFLFASVALIFSAESDKILFSEFLTISLVSLISLIGLVSSVSTFLAVSAAYSAIKSIKDLWVDKYEPLSIDFDCVADHRQVSPIDRPEVKDTKFRNDPLRMLPYIKGGTFRKKIAKQGRYIARSMPILIGAAWLCILCASMLKSMMSLSTD